MLQRAENAEGKDSSVEIIENPRGSGVENPDDMMNAFVRNDEIHHVAGSSGFSSVGRNRVTILNRFFNNGNVQHAAVPPDVSENRSIYRKRVGKPVQVIARGKIIIVTKKENRGIRDNGYIADMTNGTIIADHVSYVA